LATRGGQTPHPRRGPTHRGEHRQPSSAVRSGDLFQPRRKLSDRFLRAYTRLTIQAIKLIIGAAIGLAMVAVISARPPARMTPNVVEAGSLVDNAQLAGQPSTATRWA
jgi:hypothetical protein